ncbi:MAG: hypothetical protein IJA79_03800 [Desulfovibrio sp.]|nr:hypothetical protein [Desulfovibrio sp.]
MILSLLHKIYYSGSKLVIINLGNHINQIKKPSKLEKEIKDENRRWQFLLNPDNKKYLLKYYREYNNINDIIEIFNFRLSGMKSIVKNGIGNLNDCASKYYNVINGERVTTDNPDVYKSKVHIFGNCNAVGVFAEDRLTVASQLQRMLNKTYPEGIKVINHANWLGLEESVRQMISPMYEFSNDDIVILLTIARCEVFTDKLKNFLNQNFYIYQDLSCIFQRPHKYGEILFDQFHMNHNGYTLISLKLFDIINMINSNNKEIKYSKSIQPYINFLRNIKSKVSQNSKCYGCVVINANPFTRGHKYLIDEALKRCDFLYIFVLDEEKSRFLFDDRIKIIHANLTGVKNIKILPAGKLIISSTTLPEYFEKENMQDVFIDTSTDLLTFSTIIAKELNIKKRFVGCEPFCNLTKLYNESMKNILPLHGIDVIEINRFSINGEYVSASKVRSLIDNKDYEKLRIMISDETYSYLAMNNIIP